MLVLSRKKEESVTITGPCTVKVLEVRGDKVRLGFEGPDGTNIWRTELRDFARNVKSAQRESV
jgi:carbon storage regulator